MLFMQDSKHKTPLAIAGVVLLMVGAFVLYRSSNDSARITQMVMEHARAWETGDVELLDSLLHEDVVFAYPGRRLNKEETIEDLEFFRDAFRDTKVYVHTIIIEGDDVAVEWQFATTRIETGQREVVSDAVIGKVQSGKFVVWKEYLDGRVKGLQADGTLGFEEGEEPFPWPLRK